MRVSLLGLDLTCILQHCYTWLTMEVFTIWHTMEVSTRWHTMEVSTRWLSLEVSAPLPPKLIVRGWLEPCTAWPRCTVNHYTFYTIQYTVHCIFYTLHCKLYTVPCTLYTVHSTLFTLHSTDLYSVQCTHYGKLYTSWPCTGRLLDQVKQNINYIPNSIE